MNSILILRSRLRHLSGSEFMVLKDRTDLGFNNLVLLDLNREPARSGVGLRESCEIHASPT
jgi:hypothetical protein